MGFPTCALIHGHCGHGANSLWPGLDGGHAVLQDELVELHCIEPPLKGLEDHQIRTLAAATFMPLSVHRGKQYLLSLRHGSVLQAQLLRDVLAGQWDAVHIGVQALEAPPPLPQTSSDATGG